MIPQKFTYPFRYVPHPLVVEAAQKLIGTIDSDPLLKYVFAEGKMLGVLVCEDPASGALTTLNAFSGLVGGRSVLPGFVPPIFDTTTVPALRNIEGPVPPETASLRFGPVDRGSAPVPSPAAPGLPIPLRYIPASAVALRCDGTASAVVVERQRGFRGKPKQRSHRPECNEGRVPLKGAVSVS